MDGTIVPEGLSISKLNATKETGKISANIETPATKDNSILFARKGPVLSVETHGPRKISVGKESAYEVKIINSGDVAAEDLVVLVNLPEWAEMIGTEASIGSTQLGASAQISAPFLWKVGGQIAGKIGVAHSASSEPVLRFGSALGVQTRVFSDYD
jgi:hypothetical protein